MLNTKNSNVARYIAHSTPAAMSGLTFSKYGFIKERISVNTNPTNKHRPDPNSSLLSARTLAIERPTITPALALKNTNPLPVEASSNILIPTSVRVSLIITLPSLNHFRLKYYSTSPPQFGQLPDAVTLFRVNLALQYPQDAIAGWEVVTKLCASEPPAGETLTALKMLIKIFKPLSNA
jgi:hypothetical protein